MRLATFSLIALALSVSSAVRPAAAANEFQVVVHPSVRGSWISRESLTAIFTGKTDKWGDKAVAKPVDQSVKSVVRHAFTAAVLGRSMGEIQRYWQDRIAAVRQFPPPIKESDDDVLAYVAANAGAVGYVNADTPVPESVKVLAIVD